MLGTMYALLSHVYPIRDLPNTRFSCVCVCVCRIFEHESSEADCLRLIVGKLPSTSSASVKPQHPAPSLPLSPHYAVLLAELAAQRGFDGYLVNVECPLKGRFDQTQAFAAWMTILQDQMRKRVGPHAETIWSVFPRRFFSDMIYLNKLGWWWWQV